MSNFDPRKTVDTPATNPNRGMNTRTYMVALLVVLLLLLVGALFFTMRPELAPKPTERKSSRLLLESDRPDLESYQPGIG